MQIKLYIWRENIPKTHIKEEKMKKVLLIVTLPLCLAMGQDAPELPGWGVYGGVVMSSASGDGRSARGKQGQTLGTNYRGQARAD